MSDPSDPSDTSDTWIDVPKPATAEQVKFFVDNGYLAMPGLIQPRELEELKADTTKLARGGYPCPNLKPITGGAEMSDKEILQNILCIHQPHGISPIMLKYVKHPQLCGVLSQITAAHLPFWDGSVKCMQSMLFVKPPGFQGQAWHQDEVYIPTRDRSLVGAWIAIDDATIENGCLWVVPQSHRSGYLFPMSEHKNPDEFDFAPESQGVDNQKAVPVEVKAGTVVYFNGHLLHRSMKNRSTIFRRVLVNHYMNAYSLLPWNHTAGVGMALQDDRHVIPVAGRDPYAHKGYLESDKNVWLRTCKANAPATPAAPAPPPAPAKTQPVVAI